MTLTTTAPTRANNPEFYGNNNDYISAIGSTHARQLVHRSRIRPDRQRHAVQRSFVLQGGFGAHPQSARTECAGRGLPGADAGRQSLQSVRIAILRSGRRTQCRWLAAPRRHAARDHPGERTFQPVPGRGQRLRPDMASAGRCARQDRRQVELGSRRASQLQLCDRQEHAARRAKACCMRRWRAPTPESAYNPFGYTFRVEDGAVVADQPHQNLPGVYESFMQEWKRYGNSTSEQCRCTHLRSRCCRSGVATSRWRSAPSIASKSTRTFVRRFTA